MSELNELKKKIFDHFNLEEVKGLCFALGLKYDELPGDRLSRKVESLLVAACEQKKLSGLHGELKKERLRVSWPLLNEIEEYDWAAVVDGWRTGWDGRTPYMGLSAFQEKDAELYFGREKLVDELLERVEQSNFVAIAGPSGSGKSSLASAGLVHALRSDRIEGSKHWLFGAMSPKGDPFRELAQMVGRITKSPDAERFVRENAAKRPTALKEQLQTFLSEDENQRCVIFIDQFEELFSQTKEEGLHQQFINVLTATVAKDGRVKIVVAMRSDFVSNLIKFDGLRALANEQMQLVGAMNVVELTRAITRPALEVGIEIDPALVDKIVFDMKGAPDALPLMSFALLDLFKVKKGIIGDAIDLTLPGYLDRGGIEEALERHAERVFETFSAEEKQVARRVFTKLVQIGRGRADTRRTAKFSELLSASGNASQVEKVIHKLADKEIRLIATGDEGERTVTLAHEKLIDVWPWLRKLVDGDRDRIQLVNEIGSAAKDWDDNNQFEGFLFSDARLKIIEDELGEDFAELDEISREFIQAGIEEQKLRVLEREQSYQREVDALNRSNRWQWVVIIILFSLLMIPLGILGRNELLKRQARTQLTDASTIDKGPLYDLRGRETNLVIVNEDFSIEIHEVTNWQYSRCVKVGACEVPVNPFFTALKKVMLQLFI